MVPRPGRIGRSEHVANADFLSIVDDHLDAVFHFLYRLTNSTEAAERTAHETFLRAYHGRAKLPPAPQIAAWLLKIAIHVSGNEPEDSRMTFEYLDDTIRSDPTQVTRTGLLTTPERNLLLWELKQGCMTAVLHCLSAGERSAFVLVEMMGMKASEASATLGISPAALKVRLSRARKKIVDYLAPRCEHVHPTNPCHCPSRLGVALRKGFIKATPGAEVSLRAPSPDPYASSPALRDVVAIYQHLPAPPVPGPLGQRIRTELQSGAWDRLERSPG
jgi:RNA polymerase sigma factor (sigma-70 family)